MKFSEFANFLNQLDQTSKRLEMTEILAKLISELNQDEIKNGIYLSLGILKAPFEDLKFNFADKQMVKTLALYSEKNPDEINKMYSKEGDLGSVGFLISKEIKNPTPSLLEVYEKLEEIALIEGTGSQDKKSQKIISLLQSLDPLSNKFAIRIILGNNRLGFTELTIVDAICKFLNDKSLKSKVEDAYNRFPDIGYITEKIKESGIDGIKKLKLNQEYLFSPKKLKDLALQKKLLKKWARFGANINLTEPEFNFT